VFRAGIVQHLKRLQQTTRAADRHQGFPALKVFTGVSKKKRLLPSLQLPRIRPTQFLTQQ
jgi:hypothetical protein